MDKKKKDEQSEIQRLFWKQAAKYLLAALALVIIYHIIIADSVQEFAAELTKFLLTAGLAIGIISLGVFINVKRYDARVAKTKDKKTKS